MVYWGVGVPHQMQHDWREVRAGWWYNWRCDLTRMADAIYVPMIYSSATVSWPVVDAIAATYPYRYWLFLNEPERLDQANMTPQQAAALYNQLQAHVAGRAKFIVGGVTCDDAGITWLMEFLPLVQNYAGAHIHLYGWDTDNEAWNSYRRNIERVREMVSGELWLSETGYLAGDDSAWVRDNWLMPLFKRVLAYVRLHRVAWYATHDYLGSRPGTNLVETDGELTALGATWVDLTRWGLWPGWNMAVPPIVESASVEEVVRGQPITAIQRYEQGGWYSWLRDRPAFLNTLTVLRPDVAYWVRVERAFIWS